jgi:hypothetical protein
MSDELWPFSGLCSDQRNVGGNILMMKKLKIYLISFILIAPPLSSEINRFEMPEPVALYYGDFSGIETFQDIAKWLKRNIRYQPDGLDRWTAPAETIRRGYGDCDDWTLLYMNIAYIKFGLKLDFTAVNDRYRIGTYPEYEAIHAEPRYKWFQIDIYTGEPITDLTYNYYIYTFDEMFRR